MSYLNCLYNIDNNYRTIPFHLKCNIAATLKTYAIFIDCYFRLISIINKHVKLN